MATLETSSETVHVLLIEDNDDHACLARIALEERWQSIEVHHAPGAEAAIEFMRDPQTPLPDLALLDLKMPGADGFDCLMAFKLHSRWRQIPVVVLTTSTSPEDRTHAYKNHANSYLVKPVDAAGYRRLAEELHRYWYNFNLPTGDKPMHPPAPPKQP